MSDSGWEYVGHPAYDIGQLRQDLERFAFLLGGSDGEALFGPGRGPSRQPPQDKLVAARRRP